MCSNAHIFSNKRLYIYIWGDGTVHKLFTGECEDPGLHTQHTQKAERVASVSTIQAFLSDSFDLASGISNNSLW